MADKSISEFFPIYKIEDKNILTTKRGVYSKIFKLKLKPIFSLNENDYKSCIQEFNNFFNYLPDYSVVHKMDVFTKEKYRKENYSYTSDNLMEAYEKKFYEYPYLAHESYVIFSKTSEQIINQKSSNSLLFRKHLIDPVLLNDKIQNEFLASIEAIYNLSKESDYLCLEELSFEETTTLFNSYLNLDFKKGNEYTSDISNEKDGYLSIGNKKCNVVAVNSVDCFSNTVNGTYIDKKYSTDNSTITFSSLYPIGLGIKQNHIVNQVFIKTDKEIVKKNLDRELKNINIFKTQKDLKRENEGFNDTRSEDIIQYLEAIDNGHTPINTHLNVILWDENTNNLKVSVDQTISSFGKLNIRANIASNEKASLYYSCFPGNIADIGLVDQTFLLLGLQSSSLNIFETINKSSKGDFGIRLSERISGAPLYVDISDTPLIAGIVNNRNKIIFGPSGSGKSFLTNHMIHNYLKHGAHCFIIDVGHSYDRLCLKEKGIYFEYTDKNPLKFNPFYLPDGGEGLSIYKKESLIKLLFTLWKSHNDEENRDEYAILSRGLDLYYKKINKDTSIFPSFNTLYEFLEKDFFPVLKEENIENLFNIKSFLNVTKMYYKGGEYDYLLNSNENLDLVKEQFIVFELDNIKDHKTLLPVVTLMIMDTFLSKMRDKRIENVRKVILIEEAWKAIANDEMAEFMKYLYKTIRKFYGEAMLVTQEVEDILNSEIVKNAIVKNTGAKILLDMSEYVNEMDRIQKLLSLTDKAKDTVLSLNKNKIPNQRYKEVFIGLGNSGDIYGVNLSWEEYATYTTEKKEKNVIMNYYEKFGDIDMAIQQFAEDKRQAA